MTGFKMKKILIFLAPLLFALFCLPVFGLSKDDKDPKIDIIFSGAIFGELEPCG